MSQHHAIPDQATLRRQLTVEADAKRDQAIFMERRVAGRCATGLNAIIDADNPIPPGEQIGFDPACGQQRFDLSHAGSGVVPDRNNTCQAVSRRAAPRRTDARRAARRIRP